MVVLNNVTLPPVIYLMGATASGKTGLAVELVERLPTILGAGVDIISVDSALVYRQMDIGTAKPEPELLARAPHRLIDILDPAESYSAARFRKDAIREIDAIHGQGRIPLLVGGTMLYFRALQYGLSDLPRADADIRRELDEDFQRLGAEAMHRRLADVDPETAGRIHPNDPQRLQRALEIYRLTGQPPSRLYNKPKPSPYSFIKLALVWNDRARLHQRIAQRVDIMMAQGFIDEVAGLQAGGDLSLHNPSMRAVGYRQVWEFLDGRWDESTCREKIIIATRQFAKRQMTWLRSETSLQWLSCQDGHLIERAISVIVSALK